MPPRQPREGRQKRSSELESKITFDREIDLDAPPGRRAEINRRHCKAGAAGRGLLIYRTNADGGIDYIEVRGAQTDLVWPAP